MIAVRTAVGWKKPVNGTLLLKELNVKNPRRPPPKHQPPPPLKPQPPPRPPPLKPQPPPPPLLQLQPPLPDQSAVPRKVVALHSAVEIINIARLTTVMMKMEKRRALTTNYRMMMKLKMNKITFIHFYIHMYRHNLI
jgi:hypothetical protein